MIFALIGLTAVVLAQYGGKTSAVIGAILMAGYGIGVIFYSLNLSCPYCRKRLDARTMPHYCPNCGKSFNAESPENKQPETKP